MMKLNFSVCILYKSNLWYTGNAHSYNIIQSTPHCEIIITSYIHIFTTLFNICYTPPSNKMDEQSQKTLRMIEQNDASLTRLLLSPTHRLQQNHHSFNSSDGRDFSRLGAAIGANTHITTLVVCLPLITAGNGGFYDGLKRNTSINKLGLVGGNIVNERGRGILKVYQEQNNNLSDIRIVGCNLENGGDGS